MSDILRPPRLPSNPSQAVQMLADYIHSLFTGIVTESELPDRIDRVAGLPLLAMTVSASPTQAEVQKVADRLDEIIKLLQIGA
jgi:hypothetical protein